MRLTFLLLLLMGLAFGSLSCSSSDEAEDSSEIAELDGEEGIDEYEDGDSAPETSAEDVAEGDEEGLDEDEQVEEEIANAEQPEEEPEQTIQEEPAEEVADIPPPEEPEEMEEPAAAPSSGPAARVTGLDFKANQGGGTVVIKTDTQVDYNVRTTGSNQFVVELSNTTVPRRFRRPYDTKEFQSSIASFNAYQGRDGDGARVVIQMRGGGQPSISQEGNRILIAASGGGGSVEVEEYASEEAPEPEVDEGISAGYSGDVRPDEQVLTNKTIADFLTGNIKFYGRPINIEFRDAEIKDVLRFIAEDTGVNILVGDKVKGKITLKLRQVPWDQALTVILQSKQLGYVKKGSVLRIAPLATIQAEANSARTVLEAQKMLLPLRTQLFPISYAKANELTPQVKGILSQRGRVQADRRTNVLVVTDIEENLRKVKSLVTKLDTQTPQVLIEAKVVEATEGFDRTIGVDWGFTGSAVGVTQGSNGTVNFTPDMSVTNIGDNATSLSLNLSLGQLDVLGDLTATLGLLESESLVKVISAPRIVTLDREQARIEQTSQIPNFGTTTTNSGFALTSVTFQEVRLQLNVTPRITQDGAIILDVNVLREVPGAVIGGESNARPVERRNAQTHVLVENGDTLVIGGIYSSNLSEGETGVPILKDIPLIGALFRKTTTSKSKNEMVIFLTPRILNKEKAFVSAGEDV